MDGQTYALLGQWLDIVGQHGGGRGTGGGRSPGASRGPGAATQRHGDMRGRHFDRRFRDYDFDGGYAYPQYQYPYPYPYPYYQEPEQIQVPVPVPYAVPQPPGAPGTMPPTTSGSWYDLAHTGPGGAPLPRAALVDAPMPTKANRDILPMSTGVPILPTQSAQITGRPQVACFVPSRVVCSNAGTAGGAADWIFNDVKVGNVSQFVQSGDVPGDLFAVNAIDTFVRFAPVQTAMDFVFVVTYIGLNESGCPFFGAVLGTAAV